ncbi:heme oxygenase (biliverdin-producing) [Variovorax sp. GT1P44]|uniref:biliverdin-producing heme oxygenase n=1 Tax=Variovorax sp. GT1P44 TaxID=3443742 RepID=UPI003F4725CF
MTPRLSESLKSETRALHTQAERSDFMRVLLRGEMGRRPYCALLRNLHAIYAALEPALQQNAAHPRLAPLDLGALQREPSLRQDLEALHGPDWRDAIAVEPAAAHYIARLESIGRTRPELLVAHAYVRYLGDLSGGQMLGRIVRATFVLGPGPGTAFYDFGHPEEAARLKQSFRVGLDAVPADEATMRAIVVEARSAFEAHRRLFDELAGSALSC